MAAQSGTLEADGLLAEVVTVDLWDGPPVPVTPGILDKDAEHAFMNGQCHALALALAEKLNKPLVVLVEYEVGEEPGEDVTSERWLAEHWLHAAVQLDWDRYLDVTGVSDQDGLLELYGDTSDHSEVVNEVVPVTAEQLERFWVHGYGVPPARDVAQTFVAPVLDAAGLVD